VRVVARALPDGLPLRLRGGAAPRPAGVARADVLARAEVLARAPADEPGFWPDGCLDFWPWEPAGPLCRSEPGWADRPWPVRP